MDTQKNDQADILPSKSQRKRDAKVLFDLGRNIVGLTKKQLAALPIDDDLLDAIELARTIKSNVARKRQIQFIAKMMRHRDMSEIQEAMSAAEREARQMTIRHHRAETWRDTLIGNGNEALTGFLAQYPVSDSQVLRQLIRTAQKESLLGKPPSAARKLFKTLREMDVNNPLPTIGADGSDE